MAGVAICGTGHTGQSPYTTSASRMCFPPRKDIARTCWWGWWNECATDSTKIVENIKIFEKQIVPICFWLSSSLLVCVCVCVCRFLRVSAFLFLSLRVLYYILDEKKIKKSATWQIFLINYVNELCSGSKHLLHVIIRIQRIYQFFNLCIRFVIQIHRHVWNPC